MKKPRTLTILPRTWKPAWASLATVVLTAACTGRAGAAPSLRQEVVVHSHRTIDRGIFGLGVQWEQYLYPPAAREWKIILQRVGFMRPGFLRVMGAKHSNWKAQPEVPLILGWAQKHNCQVILGTWWAPPLDHRYEHTPIAFRRLYRWADDTARNIVRLRKKDGFTCIRFYNFANEPEHVPISRWADLVNNLHAAFERAGLAGKVGIIGPDTYGNPPANYHRSITFKWNTSAAARAGYNWPLLAQVAHEASRDVGMFDIHWYARNNQILSNIVGRTLVREKQMVESLAPNARNKLFVISESGLIQGRCNGDQQPRVKTFGYGVLMADYAAQVFRAGWNGISAWDLDDAMCVVNGKAIIHPPGKLTLKIWGFWNSQGAAMGNPADFDIRPWFYTWSLLSRMFPAGTRIVDSTEPAGSKRFRSLAGLRMVNNRLVMSIALINDVKKRRIITVRIPADSHATNFTEYRYFRNDRPVNGQGFPIAAKLLHNVNPARGMTITMPGQGVVLFTNQRPFQSP